MTKLYLAYGSNLNKAAMRRRCSGARPLGKIMLTNAKLVFRGVADLEYSPGSLAPCGVWSITDADERQLDIYEGVSSGMYYKEYGVRLKFKGKTHAPLVYLMTSEGIYPPCQAYADTIRKGYEDFGLDQSYLDAAIEHSFDDKNPDDQTRSRRQRQRASVATTELVEMPESVVQRRFEAQLKQAERKN